MLNFDQIARKLESNLRKVLSERAGGYRINDRRGQGSRDRVEPKIDCRASESGLNKDHYSDALRYSGPEDIKDLGEKIGRIEFARPYGIAPTWTKEQRKRIGMSPVEYARLTASMHPITGDDVTNVRISLETAKDVNEFLGEM